MSQSDFRSIVVLSQMKVMMAPFIKNTLNIKQVHAIVKQIKNAMNDTCGDCTVRASLGEKLKNIRTPIMGD